MVMSLVASSWMALTSTYQGMILRLGQLQEKRLELGREMDRHELSILAAAQLNYANQTPGKLADEPIGMSRRSRPIPRSGRTTHKK